jgi:hypothetical protein
MFVTTEQGAESAYTNIASGTCKVCTNAQHATKGRVCAVKIWNRVTSFYSTIFLQFSAYPSALGEVDYMNLSIEI